MPNAATIWRVSLPCSGKKGGQVQIFIDLTLVGPLGSLQSVDEDKKSSPASTKLRLRRSKNCTTLFDDVGSKPGSSVGSSGSGVQRDTLQPSTPPHMVFLGAVLSAVIVIVLLVICAIVIHMRSRNKFPANPRSAQQQQLHTHGPSASATSTTTFMPQLHQQQQQQQQLLIYEPHPPLPNPHYSLGN